MNTALIKDYKLGIAHYDADVEILEVEYGKDYWDKYQRYKNTEIAKSINAGRAQMVKDYNLESVLDIGVGSGEFIEEMQKSAPEIGVAGWDVNAYAVAWLRGKQIFFSPYLALPASESPAHFMAFDGFTFWDSLEHLRHPCFLMSRLLAYRVKYLFISIPIFKSLKDIEESKHYRPGEHWIYFTENGLLNFMAMFYRCVDRRDFEIKAGRENIYSYVFRRT